MDKKLVEIVGAGFHSRPHADTKYYREGTETLPYKIKNEVRRKLDEICLKQNADPYGSANIVNLDIKSCPALGGASRSFSSTTVIS